MPQNGFFPPFGTPQDFFHKSGSVTFVPLCALTSCKKLEKTNKQSLTYLKTDQRMDGPRTNKGVNPGSTMEGVRFERVDGFEGSIKYCNYQPLLCLPLKFSSNFYNVIHEYIFWYILDIALSLVVYVSLNSFHLRKNCNWSVKN